VTLERDGDGTCLVLLHHGLSDAVRDAHDEGWTHYLARLVPVADGEMARCGYTWAMIIDRLAGQVGRRERAPYFTAGAPLPR
jgi:hypothetical protein